MIHVAVNEGVAGWQQVRIFKSQLDFIHRCEQYGDVLLHCRCVQKIGTPLTRLSHPQVDHPENDDVAEFLASNTIGFVLRSVVAHFAGYAVHLVRPGFGDLL